MKCLMEHACEDKRDKNKSKAAEKGNSQQDLVFFPAVAVAAALGVIHRISFGVGTK